MPAPARRLPVVAAALAVALALAAGCTQEVPGRAGAAATPVTSGSPAEPFAVALEAPEAPASGAADAATEALQEFWQGAFPVAFGRSWRDIMTFAPVHTGRPDAPPPPCVNRAADLAGQAFYCPSADAVVWDADGLLTGLHERYGPAGVVVVLAHEVGHAVQTRLGVDAAQERQPRRHPTILLEAMADCYAGVALAHLAERPVAGLPMGPAERDDALRALVGFRDPVGVDAADGSAHGNAFDRVSAFQDGYGSAADAPGDGANRCAGMTLDNRVFTQRSFASEADMARGGNLPLDQLLASVERDASGWFAQLAPHERAPRLAASAGCPVPVLAAQGPVAFCPADGGVAVDPAALAGVHRELGDFAGATLVASRYGLAVLAGRGRATEGRAAGAAATCLAGAYAGRLIDSPGGFSLSPGDLDEAVQVLLAGDWAARDTAGDADRADHGYERVARFRTGLLAGPAACLPTG